MRALILAVASTLALGTPHVASAQDAAPEAPESALADRLADPAEQEKMAGMIEAMGHILLELPLGQFAESMAEVAGEDGAHFDRNATLAEMAGPGADDMPSMVADRVPQMMGMLAGMMHGFEELRPALEQMSSTMRQQLEAAKKR